MWGFWDALPPVALRPEELAAALPSIPNDRPVRAYHAYDTRDALGERDEPIDWVLVKWPNAVSLVSRVDTDDGSWERSKHWPDVEGDEFPRIKRLIDKERHWKVVAVAEHLGGPSAGVERAYMDPEGGILMRVLTGDEESFEATAGGEVTMAGPLGDAWARVTPSWESETYPIGRVNILGGDVDMPDVGESLGDLVVASIEAEAYDGGDVVTYLVLVGVSDTTIELTIDAPIPNAEPGKQAIVHNDGSNGGLTVELEV